MLDVAAREHVGDEDVDALCLERRLERQRLRVRLAEAERDEDSGRLMNRRLRISGGACALRSRRKGRSSVSATPGSASVGGKIASIAKRVNQFTQSRSYAGPPEL